MSILCLCFQKTCRIIFIFTALGLLPLLTTSTSTSTPTSTEDLQQQKLLLLPDHDTDIHSTIEPPPIVTTFPVDPTGTDKHKGESFVNGEFYCREYHVTL